MASFINALRLKYYDYYERYLRHRYHFEFPRIEASVTAVNLNSIVKDSFANISSDIVPLLTAIKIAKINTKKSTLLDIGCGTGKIISLAAILKFKRVLGIEMDLQGLEYAKRNMLNTGHKNYTIEYADATTYEIPADVSLIYFFNPFGAKSMAIVAQKIIKSYKQVNRKIQIVYQNPEQELTLINAGFTKTYEHKIRANKIYFSILELLPV
jgi:SAM-dependent methyltransferase